MFLTIGKGVIFTEEEYNNLKVGDKVRVAFSDEEYALVTEVNESETGESRVVLDDYLWFSQGVYTENETDYILMSDSSNPVYTDPVLLVVDLTSDSEVTDTFQWLLGDNFQDSMDQFIEDNGYTDPLRTSVFWYYSMTYEFFRESSNGWTPTWGLVYPVIIEDGEITSINIEWR